MSDASVLDRIRSTLTGLAGSADVPMQGVWYGMCREKTLPVWNYFVFDRLRTTKNNTGSRTDLQTMYEVHIVHEDYIPEGYVNTVIDALQSQDPDMPGTKLKLTNDDIIYNYTMKQNTTMVVEIATITFYHPEKRC